MQISKHRSLLFSAVALLLILSLPIAPATQRVNQTTEKAKWRWVWSDEFTGTNGPAVDTTKWGFDIGGKGWGNNELQTYTDRTTNAFVRNGLLNIKVLREKFTGPDNISREYTSARLLTENKFTQRYGRFEARIKVPYGQGIWPAFWMLGDNIRTAGWPQCGEIDIMEYIGREPFKVFGTLHGPGYSGANGLSTTRTLTNGKKVSDDFHTFAIEWEPNVIRFYIDRMLYKTRTPAELPAGASWVFDRPFFLILNVAVGGNFPGNPDATTVFPQSMQVDYVRVYKRADL